jgi:hypothetical protein
MKMISLLGRLSGVAVLLLTASLGRADDVRAVHSSNWSFPSTWSNNAVPGPSDNVTIPVGFTVTVNIDGSCNNLTVNPGPDTTGHVNAAIQIGTGKSLTVGGTFTWGFDGTHPGAVYVYDGGVMTLNGPVVTTSGTRLQAGLGTIILSGSTPQTLSFPTTLFGGQPVDNSFYSLTVNNPSGVTFLSNQTVKGTLALLSGNIDMGSHTLIIDATGSVSRTSGHIIGSLQKSVATGATSLTFEIGDASNYTPVDVSFGSVSTTGYLTASTTAGDHPNISGSGIDAAKSVNRYYTLTNNGVTFDNYSATFNFVAGDVDGGANTANFVVKKYSSGSWSSPAMGTVATTSAQVTGVTSFSDFAIGEAAVLASIKIFLQGPYSGSSMSTALKTAGVIPTTDPYSGTETVASIPAGVVDWVRVQLRSNTTTTVATRAAFVKSDGTVVDKDGTSPVSFTGASPASYYVVVRHRNHLAIMSASAVALSGSTSLYDFTTAQSQAYGASPMKGLGAGNTAPFALYAGDANGDGQITSTDFNVFNPKFTSGATGYQASDWNMDDQVTSTDFNLFNPNFTSGRATQVP